MASREQNYHMKARSLGVPVLDEAGLTDLLPKSGGG